MEGLSAIIIAAGKGTRMKSSRAKTLHELRGKPMLSYVVDAARKAGAEKIVLVISPDMQAVTDIYQDTVHFAFQEEQLGTGHAVKMAEGLFTGSFGDVLVLCGDTPLLTADLLSALVKTHRQAKAAATVLSAQPADPAGYGRIVRSAAGDVERIVEERDADPAIRALTEVNTGCYCFDSQALLAALPHLQCSNAQKEYYLTDVISIIKERGLDVQAYLAPDASLTQGINNRVQLSAAEAVIGQAINERHMLAGVTIIDPSSTFIDAEVTIGCDTVIYPFTILRGKTSISGNCAIGPNAHIKDSVVEERAQIQNAVVVGAHIGRGADVGPFTYLRPGTFLSDDTKAGTFVEMKKARIGRGSKVPHLSYVGDANLGQRVNIGAGTITCNFDGLRKNTTDIADDVFIGSNSSLVAPVVIGQGAFTGAGSTITEDVPAEALALGRALQKNIEGWVEKRRQKGLLPKKEE